MWSKARLTIYITGLLASAAFVLTVLGAGTYDPVTWTFTLHPFDVRWLAGVIAGPVSAAIASVAVVLKWGAT